MSEYHEDVEWDDRTGIPYINGSTKIPHSKDYWFPTSELGQPEMSIEQPQQAELNEDIVLQWFYKGLKRASKMPFSRLDEDSGGGSEFFGVLEGGEVCLFQTVACCGLCNDKL